MATTAASHSAALQPAPPAISAPTPKIAAAVTIDSAVIPRRQIGEGVSRRSPNCTRKRNAATWIRPRSTSRPPISPGSRYWRWIGTKTRPHTASASTNAKAASQMRLDVRVRRVARRRCSHTAKPSEKKTSPCANRMMVSF